MPSVTYLMLESAQRARLEARTTPVQRHPCLSSISLKLKKETAMARTVADQLAEISRHGGSQTDLC